MTTRTALQTLVAQGESETVELKRSTAELKRAGESLCAFLNSKFRNPVRGPIALGYGAHYGLGLFAAVNDS